jgi:hypothetical protein
MDGLSGGLRIVGMRRSIRLEQICRQILIESFELRVVLKNGWIARWYHCHGGCGLEIGDQVKAGDQISRYSPPANVHSLLSGIYLYRGLDTAVLQTNVLSGVWIEIQIFRFRFHISFVIIHALGAITTLS